jgi:imidazolonepropionase-like amidohydrolase
MRMRLFVIFACTLATAASGAAAQRGGRGGAAPQTIFVTDTTLIDGTGAPPRPHTTIVIRDGKIADLTTGELIDATAGETVIDGAGRFAIPGLIDAHVHLGGSTWQQRSDQLKQALEGGVTAVFDLAGDTRINGDLARATETGEIEGPHIFYCALMAGPPFFTDPRVLDASRGYTPGEAPFMRAITPDTDIVRAVAMAKGTGATALKLYAALDATEVARISAEAKAQGLRIVAHATVFPAKPSDVVAAGATLLAHAAYLVWEGSPATPEYQKRASGDFAHVAPDAGPVEAVLEDMKRRGTALNPTLWVFAEGQPKDALSDQRIAWQNAVTTRAAALGISIVAGTDGLLGRGAGALPNLHRELELLVHGAGLTPMQAIQSATINAARVMGADTAIGSIAVGKTADVLLLSANPLDDIAHTRDIVSVIARGRVVARPAK